MKTRHTRLLLPATALCLLFSALWLSAPPAHAAKGGANIGKQLNRASKAGSKASKTNRKNSRPDGTADGPIANIGENWFLEFSPSIVNASTPLDKFYGASLTLGYRVTQEDKVQIEIGLYNSTQYSTPYTYIRAGLTYDGTVTPAAGGAPYAFLPPAANYNMTYNGTRTAKARMIPLLLSYSYCIQLDAPGRWEVRITPAMGVIDMTAKWSVNATGQTTLYNPAGPLVIDTLHQPAPGSTFTHDPTTEGPKGETVRGTDRYSGTDSNYFAFAIGGGVAISWSFSERWYAEIGWRYLWTGRAPNKQGNFYTPLPAPQNWNGASPCNSVTTWNGMNLTFYTATLGWKF